MRVIKRLFDHYKIGRAVTGSPNFVFLGHTSSSGTAVRVSHASRTESAS